MTYDEKEKYFGLECVICGTQTVHRGRGRSGPAKIHCGDIVCEETTKQLPFRKLLRHGNEIPKGYFLWGELTISSGDILRLNEWARHSSIEIFWDWRKHGNEIQNKRREIMAVMYLNGQIELSEEAVPYLDKNYCKPIKYKQSIKQFSYENFKSNFDALRNHGWSDLLLSGVTPTRSKSPKNAKHH